MQMNPDLIFHSTCPLSKGPPSSVYPASIADEWASGTRFQEAGSSSTEKEHRLHSWEVEDSDLASLHLSCLSFPAGRRRMSTMLALVMSQEVLVLGLQ